MNGFVGSLGSVRPANLQSDLPEVTLDGPDTLPSSAVTAAVPPGFISFCLRDADQCAAPAPAAPRELVPTPSTWERLKQINLDVNESIWPESDLRHFGRAEYWNIPTDGLGDCEDFALLKRKDLIAAGIPVGALRLAVVLTPNRAGHVVLDVVTDEGDFVLDNLTDDVRNWDRTGYVWIERQDPGRQFGWISLQPSDRMLATSAQGLVTGSAK